MQVKRASLFSFHLKARHSPADTQRLLRRIKLLGNEKVTPALRFAFKEQEWMWGEKQSFLPGDLGEAIRSWLVRRHCRRRCLHMEWSSFPGEWQQCARLLRKCGSCGGAQGRRT